MAIVSSSFFPRVGGAEVTAHNLAKYLIENETAEGDTLTKLFDLNSDDPPEPPITHDKPPVEPATTATSVEEAVDGVGESSSAPKEQPGPA